MPLTPGTRNAAGEMMASPITVTGSTLEPGTPVVLFPTRIVGGGVDVEFGRQYDVAPDGRFLINMELIDRECGRFSWHGSSDSARVRTLRRWFRLRWLAANHVQGLTWW